MANSKVLKEQNAYFKIYEKEMNDIQFMQNYKNDWDIFNPESVKFKNFLVESFAFLHPDFHYLSFLNNDALIQELVKVAGIFQILMINAIPKNFKFFDDMNSDEIHKFWLRFFALFKDKGEFFKIDHTVNDNCNTQFFKSINGTLNYLNLDFPEINPNKLQNINFNSEIEKWKDDRVVLQESMPVESSFEKFEEDIIQPGNLEKLIEDINHVASKYSNITVSKFENETIYSDFLINFTTLAEDILKYKSDLNIIDSTALDGIFDLFESKKNNYGLGDIYFVKRYNNLIKLLKSKLRLIS